MDSLRQGHKELLEELTKICSRIDTKVGAELDDANFTSISRDELRFLREQPGRVEDLANKNARLIRDWKQDRDKLSQLEAQEHKRLAEAPKQAEHREHSYNFASPAGLSDPGSSPNLALAPIDLVSPAGNVCELDSTMKDKYHALVPKFNKLYENHKAVKDANRQLAGSLVKQKSLAKAWRANADLLKKTVAENNDKIQRLQGEILTLQARLENDRVTNDAVAAAPRAGGPLHSLGEEKEGSPSTSNTQAAIPASSPVKGPGAEHAFNENIGVEDTQFEPLEPDHSSSTEDDMPPAFPRSPGPGSHTAKEARSYDPQQLSSSPVVVSSRRVKKRKSTKQAERSPDMKVKVETVSSSPVGLAAMRYLDHGQSIDLDQIGQKVNTPKKRRRELELSRQASKLSNESQFSVGSPSPSQHASDDDSPSEQKITISQVGFREAESPLQPLDPNSLVLPRTLDAEASNKRRRLIIEKAIEGVSEDGQNIAPLQTRRQGNTPDSNYRLDGLLDQPSPARSILSPARLSRPHSPLGTDSPAGGRTPSKSGLAREVNVGRSKEGLRPSKSEEQSPYVNQPGSVSKGASSNSVEPARPSSNATFRSAVEPSRDGNGKSTEMSRPTNNIARTTAGITTPTSKGVARNPIEHSRPSYQRAGGSIDPSRPSSSRHRGPRGAEEDPPWDDTPDNEPLRCREIRMLSPQDFKINPAYNQGYNYAFTDVVRNRYERQCLSSCTKPGCCGKQFRALAIMFFDREIAPNPSQQEADEKLAKDFLGGNAYKFQGMSKDERKEILVQAKTRELANQFGRHRHAYERPKSPPGFWDADFPTTQEQMAQREKAHEFERELVARRYEEAMRPGGAYIFRDE
ncbi:uncharacterized protein BP5553_05182 [Venustampulla echinocandica]|uniref:DNA endonuclease activator Ctp1 C-terminal domain-containing protein n=1 Tax=Venustampulla echinocandica TaxID=2656787 RepID=A0A370TQF1_9HELO|nr:uncharacterized protein BP5553_05182 [Venustampulla echinocandica]RDL37749.1 hypothetical protein BP5553_05182 [Venustampulla echinocandica]